MPDENGNWVQGDCVAWKCTRAAAYDVLQQVDGTVRVKWMGYCEYHFQLWEPEGTVMKLSDGGL